MTNKEAKAYAELAVQSIKNDNDENTIAYEFYAYVIKALSKPTIPLSIIEKIHDAIDNADCDACLEDESGSFTEEVFTIEHVHEIIDKAVKECTHE